MDWGDIHSPGMGQLTGWWKRVWAIAATSNACSRHQHTHTTHLTTYTWHACVYGGVARHSLTFIHTCIHTIQYIALHYITLHLITLQYITTHHITYIHYMTLHYTTIHYAARHYTASPYICTCIPCIHTYIHAYIHAYVHAYVTYITCLHNIHA